MYYMYISKASVLQNNKKKSSSLSNRTNYA